MSSALYVWNCNCIHKIYVVDVLEWRVGARVYFAKIMQGIQMVMGCVHLHMSVNLVRSTLIKFLSWAQSSGRISEHLFVSVPYVCPS